MNQSKRFLKVEETLDYINSLEQRGARKSDLIGFRSNEVNKEYKHIISICTSMSVIVMQYDLFHIALELINKAIETYDKLEKSITSASGLWTGRLHIFTNSTFLYSRLGCLELSLNCAFESQCYLLSLQEANIHVHEELKISTNMATFMVLWLKRMYQESSIYLDLAAKSVNNIIKGTPTKLNKNDIQNLYGLIICSLASLSLAMGGDAHKSIELCKKCEQELNSSASLLPILNSTISSLSAFKPAVHNTSDSFTPQSKISSLYSFPKLSSDVLNNPVPPEEDWLVNKNFQSLLLQSVFYPIINPNTPALRKEELEFEQAKTKILDFLEDVNEDRGNHSVPRRLVSKNEPRRATGSVVRDRKVSQPWWKNKEFMDNVFRRAALRNSDVSPLREKRRRDGKEVSPEMQVREIYAARVSPRRSVGRKRKDEAYRAEYNYTGGLGSKAPAVLMPIFTNKHTVN